jgi:hypothetical protein
MDHVSILRHIADLRRHGKYEGVKAKAAHTGTLQIIASPS